MPKAKLKPAVIKPRKCTLVPFGDRVVIKRDDAESTSGGGILLPAKLIAGDKPKRGIVLAIGAGSILKDGTRHAMTAKVGDRVFFNTYPGCEIEHGPHKELFVIIREHDILAADVS